MPHFPDLYPLLNPKVTSSKSTAEKAEDATKNAKKNVTFALIITPDGGLSLSEPGFSGLSILSVCVAYPVRLGNRTYRFLCSLRSAFLKLTPIGFAALCPTDIYTWFLLPNSRYNTKLTGFVARGPPCLAMLTLSENFESS